MTTKSPSTSEWAPTTYTACLAIVAVPFTVDVCIVDSNIEYI